MVAFCVCFLLEHVLVCGKTPPRRLHAPSKAAGIQCLEKSRKVDPNSEKFAGRHLQNLPKLRPLLDFLCWSGPAPQLHVAVAFASTTKAAGFASPQKTAPVLACLFQSFCGPSRANFVFFASNSLSASAYSCFRFIFSRLLCMYSVLPAIRARSIASCTCSKGWAAG